jgi:hypothetical protein
MAADSAEQQDGEERLAVVLVSCLEALDKGQAVDRQELLARHPEFAAELGKFLDDQGQVDRFAAPLRAVAEGLPGQLSAPATLGDFRIVRMVGRGGMGVVYEAKQLSLGRQVALKVLPFAATMDPRQLQRFHNEARAAASLEHPHIVPVYGVGCEGGVHYYAMKFIDGQGLDALLQELRRPATPPFLPASPQATETVAGRKEATKPAPFDAAYFRRVAERAYRRPRRWSTRIPWAWFIATSSRAT